MSFHERDTTSNLQVIMCMVETDGTASQRAGTKPRQGPCFEGAINTTRGYKGSI